MVAPGYRQIRFWGEAYGGATLVYDYQRGQWSRWTSMNAVSAVDWNGAFTYLSQSATGGVWTELGLGSSSFVDENGNIGALIQTGWISQTGPLGWGRVYNLWLSGAWVTGQSALTITTQYDEDPSYSDTQTITPATETATPAGETSPPRLLRIDLKRQRFSSVRFQIAEVAASAVPMTLNGFVLQVQPLSGPKRIGPQGNYAG